MERLEGLFNPTKPPQFSCPFIQFAGKTDKIISVNCTKTLKYVLLSSSSHYLPSRVSDTRDYTSGSFTYYEIDAGHFFLTNPRFLELLRSELDDINDYQV